MIPEVERPYAGLILPDTTHLDAEPYLDSAAEVLAMFDPLTNGGTKRPTKDTVFGDHYGVRVTSEADGPFGPRVLIEMMSVRGLLADIEDMRAALILSETVQSALRHSSADIIEWYRSGTFIDCGDFVRLRTYVSPRRVSSKGEPVHQDISAPVEERYDVTGQGADTATVPLRAAAWLMACVTLILSWPLGVATLVIAYFRGMHFVIAMRMLLLAALLSLYETVIRAQPILAQFLP